MEMTPLNAISSSERDPLITAADATTVPCTNWLDDDVDDLRVAILMDAIHRLFDSRIALAQWCEEFAWLIDDGAEPFGFRACAVAADTDPGELRSLILDLKCRQRTVFGVSV